MINNNFWLKLNKNFLALAPMAGITDLPFRLICSKFGADVVYSEMANATALVYQPLKTLELLRSSNEESYRVFQLFGSDPKHFAYSAKLLSDETEARKILPNYRRPDGLDINLGCPVSKVLKTGSGAMLFQDLERAHECIKAVIDNTDLPVSVKIRRQAGETKALDFINKMSDLDIKAIMVHGRSLAEGFSGPINYQSVKEIKQAFSGVLMVNGGIKTPADFRTAMVETGADGAGLARGVYGRPWLFKEIKDSKWQANRQLIFETIKQHAELVHNDNDYFLEFRKHLCWYVTGLEGAKEMRGEAVKINNFSEVLKFIDKYQDEIKTAN